MQKRRIGPRPRSRDELAAWYGAVLEEQAESGLSLNAYADLVGVSAWTLYDWRRRLERGEDAPAQQRTLVEVAVSAPAESSAPGLAVQVCDGRRTIVVPAGFDDEDLRRVVAVLESC